MPMAPVRVFALNPGQYVEAPLVMVGAFFMLGLAAWVASRWPRSVGAWSFAVLLAVRGGIDLTHGLGHIYEPMFLEGGLRPDPGIVPWQHHWALLLAAPALTLGFVHAHGAESRGRTAHPLVLGGSLVAAIGLAVWYYADAQRFIGTVDEAGPLSWLKFRVVEPFYGLAGLAFALRWKDATGPRVRRGLLLLSLAFVLLPAFEFWRLFNSGAALAMGAQGATPWATLLWDTATLLAVAATVAVYAVGARRGDPMRNQATVAMIAVGVAYATAIVFLLTFWQGDATMALDTVISYYAVVWFLSFPVLAGVAVIFTPVMQPGAQDDAQAAEEAGPEGTTPADIEGADPHSARLLGAAGVRTADDLLDADAAALAQETGIDQERIDAWRARIELGRLASVGGQYGDLLAGAGIRGVDDLARRTPRSVETAIERHVQAADPPIVRQPYDRRLVKRWIDEARRVADADA